MENNSASQTLAGSPALYPANSFRFWPTLFAFAGAIVLLFVVMAIGIGYYLGTHAFDFAGLQRAATGIFGVQLQGIAELITIGYLLIVLPKLAKTTLAGIGFRSVRANDAVTIVLGIVTMAVVVTLLGTVLSKILNAHAPEEAIKVFMGLKTVFAKAGFAFFAVVLAPFFEEFIFRLFLFNAFRRWWGFWPGAIVSAILFGCAHIQQSPANVNVALIVPLALGGLILAWIYNKTENAWAPMLTHAGFNGITLLAVFFAPQLAK